MAARWYYQKNGTQFGPVRSRELKAMAVSGKLLPADLIKRDDMPGWRSAGSINVLFAPASIEASTDPVPVVPSVWEIDERTENDKSSSSPSDSKRIPFWESPILITVSMVLCFPVGLLMVWMHSTWSNSQKWIWTGALAIFLVILSIIGDQARKEDLRLLAAADAKWQDGDKASAVAMYRPLLSRLRESEASLAYGRVVDFDVENGDSGSTRKLMEAAATRKVYPSVNHPEAKNLRAKIDAEAMILHAKVDAEARIAAAKSIVPDTPAQIPHDQAPENHGKAILSDVSSGGQSVTAESKTAAPLGATPLKTAVTTPQGQDYNGWSQARFANRFMKRATSYKTESEVIIDIEVGLELPMATGVFPLLVRLFDEDGNYLTHFVTKEKYTINATFLSPGFIPFRRTGNRLIYPVNRRDLRDTAILEVGFCGN